MPAKTSANPYDATPAGPGDIPVLDLGPYLAGEPDALEPLAACLRDACERVGFYCVENHGVPAERIRAAFDAARRFHAQPLEAKMALKANEHNIGYLPMRGSVTRSAGFYDNEKPNLNEAFFVKRDLPADHPDVVAGKRFRGMNQWPSGLPGFRETVLAYLEAAEGLALRLLPVYARALDLPADWFENAFADPQFSFRMTRYPPFDEVGRDQFAVAPHTDSGFLTLLPQSDLPGLTVLTADGRWIEPPMMPGTYLVNTGDLLHRWTNERFLSTPHCAVNRSGRERYAIPFFFDCNIDHVMTCLPTCRSADNPPRYPPTTYLEYMTWFTGKNYDHVRERVGVPAD